MDALMRAGWLPFALVAALLAPVPAAAEHASGIQWACGFGGSGRNGHPDDCGIDPVGGEGVGADGQPTWGDAWIDGDERVLGVVIHGDARAIPVKMLDRHEILNDEIGGVPVAVTYCPLCGSGLTFDRRIQIGNMDVVLDFTASGFLYKHDLVMWDPQTGTLWTQILGEPIATLRDEHADADHMEASLDVYPTTVAPWDDWRRKHPDSPMLQGVQGISYGGAYAGYEGSCRFGISGQSECDVDGLHPKEEVAGVEAPGGPVAFPVFGLRDDGVAFEETTGVVAAVDEAGTATAYDADGHTFTRSGGTWIDEAGRPWDLAEGRSADGAETLAPLDTFPMYWFAWREHHPDTALWLPADAEGQRALEPDGGVPLPLAVAVWIGMTLVAFWIIIAIAQRVRRRRG